MTALKLDIPRAFAELLKPKRYKVFYGGRGAAKSRTFGIILLAIGVTKPIGVLCARELQVSIKDSVHSLLAEIINSDPLFSAFYEIKEKEIIGKNSTRFSFKGLRHNINEIKSYQGVDVCWVEEAQAVSDKSWETLIPTVRKENSEIWISYNPKNPTDPTHRRFVLNADDDMLVKKVSWRDNPFFPSVLEKERLKLLKEDAEAYEHVWEGEFDTRFSGSVYAKYVNQNQVMQVDYDKTLPIYTAWDLGYDDATAIIWFQVAKGEIHVIDYYESNFEDAHHYCEQLYGKKIVVDERDMRSGRIIRWHLGEMIDEYRASYDYTGCKHYVPHDAANKLLQAGGRSFVEQCKEFGITTHVIPAASQQDSEAALRKALNICWFDSANTQDLVQALLNYHYEFDEDKKVYSKLPLHDWSSHACDAAEIMARAWKNSGLDMGQIKVRKQEAEFYAKRRKHKLDYIDPYRIKPIRKKR